MPLINITSESGNAEDLFKQPEYPVLPAGKHLFVVAKPIKMEKSSSAAQMEVPEEDRNNIVKAEFRCQDEDANKGMVVFENFVFINNPQTDGQKKSLEINNARFAQFTVSCGVATVEQIKAEEQFDLDDFETKIFSAVSIVKLEDSQEIDPSTDKPIKKQKASIKQFLFESE